MPRISYDSIQPRLVLRRPQVAEQMVEVPTEPGTHLRFSPRRSFRGWSFLAFSQDRVQQRLGPGFWRRSLTIQFLRVVEVVVHVEVFKVLAQDRIQQQRTWSRSLIFQLAEVFQIFSHARVPQLPHLVDCLTMQMREFKGFFSHTSPSEKSAKLGPHSSLCGLP